MELKLNKMNKALFRDRAKKLMLTGALAGVIAGVAITSGISSITLKKAEKKLEISNAKLQEQTKKNEELQAELDKEEVTENTAELLASDDDRWCLALVNGEASIGYFLCAGESNGDKWWKTDRFQDGRQSE